MLVQAQTYLDYLSSCWKIYQNMKAYQPHPFCLESNLTITGRHWEDDRWQNVEENRKWQFHTKII